MMKRLCIFFTAFCLAMPLFAAEKIDKIDLESKEGGRHKLPSKDPIPTFSSIEAFLDDSSKELSLVFADDLGIVYVTVLGANGNIVLSDVVNGSANTSISLVLNPEMSGDYELSIQYEDKELCGTFFID